MRIEFVIETLGRGGAERLLVSTLKFLDRTRFFPSVTTLFGPNPLAEELIAADVPVTELGLRGRTDLVRGYLNLREHLRNVAPDVVHTHLYFANIIGRLAAPGHSKVVTTLHNPDYGFEDPGTLLFRGKKELDRITGNWRNAAFVAVSEAVRGDYSRHLEFSPIHVLHNFVVLRELDRALGRVDRTAARRELEVGEGELLILHVGRHHRQKGLDLLLEALARLREAGVPAVFRQAGQGGLTEALKEQARSLGLGTTTRLLGPMADVASLYRAADIFAFPSRYEAFGISLLEAMAARLPCVASAAGGIEEVVGGSGAILVPPGDVSALTSALHQLCVDRDQRSRQGDAARARAEAFDVHAQLPRLEALYATL